MVYELYLCDNGLLFYIKKCDMNCINLPYRLLMSGIGSLKKISHLFFINLKTIAPVYMTILFY